MKTHYSGVLEEMPSKKLRTNYTKINRYVNHIIDADQKENIKENYMIESYCIIKNFQASFSVLKPTKKPNFGGPNSAFDWVKKKSIPI
jgi:hypothetical protein